MKTIPLGVNLNSLRYNRIKSKFLREDLMNLIGNAHTCHSGKDIDNPVKRN